MHQLRTRLGRETEQSALFYMTRGIKVCRNEAPVLQEVIIIHYEVTWCSGTLQSELEGLQDMYHNQFRGSSLYGGWGGGIRGLGLMASPPPFFRETGISQSHPKVRPGLKGKWPSSLLLPIYLVIQYTFLTVFLPCFNSIFDDALRITSCRARAPNLIMIYDHQPLFDMNVFSLPQNEPIIALHLPRSLPCFHGRPERTECSEEVKFSMKNHNHYLTCKLWAILIQTE